MKLVFILIGFIACLVAVGFCILFIVALFLEWHKEYKYKQEYTHRFDKPPTAKCYCKDCKRWDSKNHFCDRYHAYMADAGFCWGAEPMSADAAAAEGITTE